MLNILLPNVLAIVSAKSFHLYPTLCDPMDCTCQAPLSMGFSRQDSWSGLPFPSPGHLPDPGMEARSPALQADPLASQPPRKPLKAYTSLRVYSIYWAVHALRSYKKTSFNTQGVKHATLRRWMKLWELQHQNGKPRIRRKEYILINLLIPSNDCRYNDMDCTRKR